MASLSSIRLEWDELELRGDLRPGVRAWYTPEGDGLGLYLFESPPDLPPGARSITEIADVYREQARPAAILEVAGVTLDGCAGLRVLMKAPQHPSGTTYVGSLTLPFRDLSYVLKVQCEERGITGIREAVLLDERLRAGGAPGGGGPPPGWDPDDEAHDARFPRHPVSRARRVLARLERSISVADELRQLPGFPLPR